MDGLQVQLVIGLDRYKAHVLALDGFGDGLGVHEIVLVGLHKGLHELGCDQPHVMALIPQRPAEEVRSRARLRANQRGLQVRRECQQLLLCELLPNENLAGSSQRDKVKGGLAQIDADFIQFHGPPPCHLLYPAGLRATDHPITQHSCCQPQSSLSNVLGSAHQSQECALGFRGEARGRSTSP